MHNGLQLVSNCFYALFTLIGLNHLNAPKFQAQTNVWTEHYSKTIITGLRYYIPKHGGDWDLIIQPLTNAYHAKVHRTDGTPPFSFILFRLQPGLIRSVPLKALPIDTNSHPPPKDPCSHHLSVYLKRCTTRTTKCGMRNRAINNNKTPKCWNKHGFALVITLCWLPSDLGKSLK